MGLSENGGLWQVIGILMGTTTFKPCGLGGTLFSAPGGIPCNDARSFRPQRWCCCRSSSCSLQLLRPCTKDKTSPGGSSGFDVQVPEEMTCADLLCIFDVTLSYLPFHSYLEIELFSTISGMG